MKLFVKLPYNYAPIDTGFSPESSTEALQKYMDYRSIAVSVVLSPEDYIFRNHSNDYGITLDDKYNIFSARFGLN